MTTATATTYDEAMKLLRARVGKQENLPEFHVLTALESPEVRKAFEKYKDLMLVGIHHPFLDDLENYPVSFEFRVLPPGLAFFPTLVTAIVDTKKRQVVEAFEVSDAPRLILGDKKLPAFCAALESTSHMFGQDSQFPFGYMHVLAAAMLPWAKHPETRSWLLDRIVNGANPWYRMCCVIRDLSEGTFAWS